LQIKFRLQGYDRLIDIVSAGTLAEAVQGVLAG